VVHLDRTQDYFTLTIDGSEIQMVLDLVLMRREAGRTGSTHFIRCIEHKLSLRLMMFVNLASRVCINAVTKVWFKRIEDLFILLEEIIKLVGSKAGDRTKLPIYRRW
jgi:hypothetical protein